MSLPNTVLDYPVGPYSNYKSPYKRKGDDIEILKGMPCEDRDWSFAATSQGSPGHIEAGRVKKDSPLVPSEEAWSFSGLDFRLLASRVVE